MKTPSIQALSWVLARSPIIYLLALAVRNGGRLVTFDRGISMKAVRRAETRHLVVL
jgi:hypothetical protein